MNEIVLGVTGTRTTPTLAQLGYLYTHMRTLHYKGCRTLHHGCCTGWDEAAHHLARSLGWRIVIHPPTNELYMAREFTDLEWPAWEVRPAKPYAERNQDIVNESTRIIAGPLHPQADERSKRSGTWMTLRMAYDARKPWSAVFPDGSTSYGEW